MSDHIFVKFYKWSATTKAAITAMFAIVAFITGAILENGVQKISSDVPGEFAFGLFWLLLSLILAIAWGGLQYWYRRVLEKHVENTALQERAIADAREKITKISVRHLASCDGLIEKETVTINELRSVLICELQRISELITAAWEVVNSHHNVSVSTTERINFEMTLITPSLKDGALTIASWCNRENQRPKSLGLRLEGQSNIYSKTEAFKMIEKSVTETKVIEDTSAPDENYESLYDDQKTRIRSSVLHPILSPQSKHLGILVLHCEEAGFFRKKDKRYWHELCGVFAPFIALELERIRAFNKVAQNWPNPPIELYSPY